MSEQIVEPEALETECPTMVEITCGDCGAVSEWPYPGTYYLTCCEAAGNRPPGDVPAPSLTDGGAR